MFHFQACLYLYDVPSVDHPGQILGSVVFGESFLDSAIKTLVPGTNHLYFVSDAELSVNRYHAYFDSMICRQFKCME